MIYNKTSNLSFMLSLQLGKSTNQRNGKSADGKSNDVIPGMCKGFCHLRLDG